MYVCMYVAYPVMVASGWQCALRRYPCGSVIKHNHSQVSAQYNFSAGPVRVHGVALALADTLFTAQLGVTVTGRPAAAAPLSFFSIQGAVALWDDRHCSRCRLYVTTFLAVL